MRAYDLRLVAAQPEQLRGGEARQRAVAGQRDQPLEPDALLDLGALRRRALVVPQDRGAEDRGRARRARPGRASGRRARCRATSSPAERGERRLGWPATSPRGPAPPSPGAAWTAGSSRSARATTSPSARDRERLDAGRADVESDQRTALADRASRRARARRAPRRRARRRGPRPCAPAPRAAPARRCARRPRR